MRPTPQQPTYVIRKARPYLMDEAAKQQAQAVGDERFAEANGRHLKAALPWVQAGDDRLGGANHKMGRGTDGKRGDHGGIAVSKKEGNDRDERPSGSGRGAETAG